MGRKGNWLSSVKKALSPNSKKKKVQKEAKSNEKWPGNEDPSVPDSSNLETLTVSHPLPVLVEDDKLIEAENEQTKHAYSVAAATAAAASAAAMAAQAASEVVRLAASTPFTGKSKEEVAAIRIQAAFRGYMAKRALRALRGLVRLKSLVDGPTVKRQTSNTLKSMQALSRVQAQICSRRIRMSEENRALQRQLLQKRARELDSLRLGEKWDDSFQSKEQIEANLLHKFEAATRRERALAYSFSHQQSLKKSSRPTNLLFTDPTNPQWGWSWLERWMAAAQPSEQGVVGEKELNGDHMSVKSTSMINMGEITKSFARHQLNSDSLSSSPANQKPNHQSPTPISKQVSSLVPRKPKPASPRVNPTTQDDDSKSILSLQSEKTRRHSIAGSSIRDDESLASSSPSVPSYMASTRSAKAKSRLQSSPLGLENGTQEKGSSVSTKKRLSFPPSPARTRRHSGPPKVDTSSSITELNE